jgi:integrase
MGAAMKTTKFRGVRYREHLTRKHGLVKDRYFFVRYQKDGKRKEEGLGWASDKKEQWTAEKAAIVLAELKAASRSGKAEPVRLSERREAEKQRREAGKAEMELAEKEKTTFGQYFEKVYLPAFETGRPEDAARKGQEHFKNWIKPVIGDTPLKDVKPFGIEKIKKNLMDAKRSPRTLEYVFATIRQAWNMARRDGLVMGESPTGEVKRPKADNKRVRFLSHEEAGNLLSALKAKDQLAHDLALLSLHSGLRAGEILALKWGHIDVDRGIINVMDSKSGKGRAAFMTEKVKAMFKTMKRRKPDDHVFTRNDKHLNDIPRVFFEVVNDLGFNEGIQDRRQRVCFHSLRHTFASWHVLSGTDIYAVKGLLGHSVIAMTERYAHLSRGALHNATANFEKALTKVVEIAGGADHGKA